MINEEQFEPTETNLSVVDVFDSKVVIYLTKATVTTEHHLNEDGSYSLVGKEVQLHNRAKDRIILAGDLVVEQSKVKDGPLGDDDVQDEFIDSLPIYDGDHRYRILDSGKVRIWNTKTFDEYETTIPEIMYRELCFQQAKKKGLLNKFLRLFVKK